MKRVQPIHKEWVFRQCKVSNHGWLEVPRYIIRIDIEDKKGPGYAGTHGWQVRYERPWRYFSDSANDRPSHVGLPEDSLRAAQRYLLALWKGHPARSMRGEWASKLSPVGISGVRVIWRKRAERSPMECYVRVDALDGSPLRVLYVATEATFTVPRLAKAIQVGRKLRLEYLQNQNAVLPQVNPVDMDLVMQDAPKAFKQSP